MSLATVALLLFIHWYADFELQTNYQAQNKSKNIWALLSHTSVYSLFFTMTIFFTLWTIDVSTYVKLIYCLKFGIITFICHTVTDYFTSKQTSKLYQKQDYHNFFVVIGFDQFLHAMQLLLTYKYVFLTNHATVQTVRAILPIYSI